MAISIIIPSKNEEASLGELLCQVKNAQPKAEIIVIDDGSTDKTPEIAINNGAKVFSHPYSMGNGAAIKTGARMAGSDTLVFMDGDGQHNPDDIAKLLKKLRMGFDMVVGARNTGSHASIGRLAANQFYNRLASFMVNHNVEDLTSGFRVVRADKFKEFLYLLPNGFSYPTTSTMAFFRAGYTVAYEPITVAKREGKSHIQPIKDGIRFLLIIFKIGSLYSPLKLFVPISFTFFLIGVIYYLYTFLSIGRFTNMSALLVSTSVIIFLIGLVSEQITQLMYSNRSQ